jgi:ABC-2 type transport system permease protein
VKISRARQALIVAGWEFQRCFRWKHVLLGVFAFSAALLLPGREFAGLVLVAVMMMALAIGMICLAAGIRREIREQAAESLAATLPAQPWLDGKVLGTAAYALSCVVIPAAAVPAILPLLLAWATLALLLWGAFGAAVAAMDDARYLARRLLLLLPILLTIPAIAVVRAPDGVAARALSVVPLTSAGAMAARLLLSEVAVAEVIVSLALLAATILAVRWVAGRVFAWGILKSISEVK